MSASTNLLHDVGELLELPPSTTATEVNDFLALGWVLLRVADGRFAYLVGWLRERGEAELPSWFESRAREREALLEALDASSLDTEAVVEALE